MCVKLQAQQCGHARSCRASPLADYTLEQYSRQNDDLSYSSSPQAFSSGLAELVAAACVVRESLGGLQRRTAIVC